jgi:hypothetical protein
MGYALLLEKAIYYQQIECSVVAVYALDTHRALTPP